MCQSIQICKKTCQCYVFTNCAIFEHFWNRLKREKLGFCPYRPGALPPMPKKRILFNIYFAFWIVDTKGEWPLLPPPPKPPSMHF